MPDEPLLRCADEFADTAEQVEKQLPPDIDSEPVSQKVGGERSAFASDAVPEMINAAVIFHRNVTVNPPLCLTI